MDRLFPLTEVLVLRAQGGDREAYGSLAALWAPVLERHAGRLCEGMGGEGEQWAQEASQEAWVGIARGLSAGAGTGGLDDPRAFGAWAMRIVARRVADRVRRARRDRRRDRSGVRRERGEGDEGGEAGGEGVWRLRVALALARDEDRAVLSMAYGKGMGAGAIAAALGVAEGTAKSRLSRAKGSLRVAMERME